MVNASARAGLERYRVPIGVAAVLAVLLLWQLVSVTTEAGRLSSSPVAVALAIPQVLGDGLVRESLYSLQGFAIGMALAVLLGIGLGLFLGTLPRLAFLLEPALMAFYITPTVALLPLIVIWFGVGSGSTAVIVFLSAVFPILINTMAGLRQGDPAWRRTIRAFGGGRLLTFRLADLPGALPEIVLGIRLGIGRGIIGIVVAEMYASSKGLGSLLDIYTRAYRISELCVVVFAIGIAGCLLVQGMKVVEDRVSLWRR
jgi:ABC-type nitrate/sulfonate/bicarbonate transport system permease component